jgi:hypothetical protein
MALYAIMVPLLGIDEDWVYVYGQDSKSWAPATYETRKEAEAAAKIWKRAKVVNYEPRT